MIDGVNLIRTLLIRIKTALPLDLRTYYYPFIYGLVGGLGFQVDWPSNPKLVRGDPG